MQLNTQRDKEVWNRAIEEFANKIKERFVLNSNKIIIDKIKKEMKK